MKERIKNIIMYTGIGLLVMLVLFIVGLSLYGMIEDERENNYCEKLFLSPITEPSVFVNSWGETSRVENGYIRCCRYKWEEHEKKKECQIFPYIKSNH